MKLYATTTSERASKGQGGNKFLKILITVGKNREKMIALELTYQPGVDGLMFYFLKTDDGHMISEKIEYPSVSI